MKTTITRLFGFLASVLTAATLTAQPITLTGADIPAPDGPLTIRNVTGLVSGGAPQGTDGTWDFGAVTGGTTFTQDYYPETLPVFVNAGVDVYRLLVKALTPASGYEVYSEIDFNDDFVGETALDIYYQPSDLSPLTGFAGDSLIINTQQLVNIDPIRYLTFPMTLGSAWSGDSRRAVSMTLKLPSAGIPMVPGEHVFHTIRQDSVLGWGKMRVNMPDGPTEWYDVLIQRGYSYTVDSFYLNGAPAPDMLLSQLGVSQGQILGSTAFENVYRAGSFGYLFRTYYGTQPNYSTPSEYYMGTDNLTLTDVDDSPMSGITFATVLYPNPCRGSELSVKFLGNQAIATHFIVTDMSGRTVADGSPASASNHQVNLRFANTLATGSYALTLLDGQGRTLMSETFEVHE